MHFEKYKFSNFIEKTSIIWNNEFLCFHFTSFRYVLKNSIWPISHDRHHSYDEPYESYDMIHMMWSILNVEPKNHKILFYLGLLLSYTECVTLDELFKRAAKMQSKSKRWGTDDNSDFLGAFSAKKILNHGPWIS